MTLLDTGRTIAKSMRFSPVDQFHLESIRKSLQAKQPVQKDYTDTEIVCYALEATAKGMKENEK